MTSFVFLSSTGCLLPFLLVFNLMFGWVFLKPFYWLLVEAALTLLFVMNSVLMAKRIRSVSRRARPGAIDVEGEVVEEKKRVPEID